MAKPGRYRAGVSAKIVGAVLTLLLLWGAWEFGLFDAIADWSTVSIRADQSG